MSGASPKHAKPPVVELSARERCRLLVERLPTEGLREAEESLAGICEHYSIETVTPPPPPVVAGRGRVTGEYVRPVFPVTEEG